MCWIDVRTIFYTFYPLAVFSFTLFVAAFSSWMCTMVCTISGQSWIKIWWLSVWIESLVETEWPGIVGRKTEEEEWTYLYEQWRQQQMYCFEIDQIVKPSKSGKALLFFLHISCSFIHSFTFHWRCCCYITWKFRVFDNMNWQYNVHSVWMIQCSIIRNENALPNQFILFVSLLMASEEWKWEKKRCGICILYRYYLFANGFCLYYAAPFFTIAKEKTDSKLQLIRIADSSTISNILHTILLWLRNVFVFCTVTNNWKFSEAIVCVPLRLQKEVQERQQL